MKFIGEKQILEFEDIIENKGLSSLLIKIAKLINPLFRSKYNPKGFIPDFKWHLEPYGLVPIRQIFFKNRLSYAISSREYGMPEDLRYKLKKIYIEDNKKLGKKYQINLPKEYYDA
jgi:hypothetical protein